MAPSFADSAARTNLGYFGELQAKYIRTGELQDYALPFISLPKMGQSTWGWVVQCIWPVGGGVTIPGASRALASPHGPPDDPLFNSE